MSTILGVLLLVGFMMVMSRMGIGCCGGHSSHGSHGGHGGHDGKSQGHGGCCGGEDRGRVRKLHEDSTISADTADEKAQDPVCGMSVSKQTAYKKTVDGADYYFCSKECRDEFHG